MANNTDEFNMKLWTQFIEEELSNESEWINYMFSCFLIIIFILSFAGNLITCIVIYSDRSMHIVTNFYLFDMALTDLIGTCAILLEVYEIFNMNYVFGPIACKVHFYCIVVLWNNSIMVMTALAIERYVAICHPLFSKTTSVCRRVLKIILCIWLIALLVSLPEIWGIRLIKTKQGTVCFSVPTTYARIINGTMALVTFVIPLLVMTTVYIIIAIKLNSFQKSSSKQKVFNHKDNRSKVNKLIVAMTLSFLVCWLPFFFMRIAIFFLNVYQLIHLAKWWSIGVKVVCLNSWFSNLLNPIIFSLMSSKFQRALKIFCSKKVLNREYEDTQTVKI